MNEQEFSEVPCLCDTGNYCRRHHRYRRPSRTPATDYEPELDHEINQSFQRCGGGRRIFRKTAGGDNY